MKIEYILGLLSQFIPSENVKQCFLGSQESQQCFTFSVGRKDRRAFSGVHTKMLGAGIMFVGQPTINQDMLIYHPSQIVFSSDENKYVGPLSILQPIAREFSQCVKGL